MKYSLILFLYFGIVGKGTKGIEFQVNKASKNKGEERKGY
jgi:hypothetical protein